jgi:hypothetical protein
VLNDLTIFSVLAPSFSYPELTLIMYVAGGGIKPYYALLQFNDRKYPENPFVQPDVKQNSRIIGKALIADDVVSSRGIILRLTKSR